MPATITSALLRLCAGLLALAIAIPSPAAADQRPNIVLIMCDDLGWGDVGFNGNEVIQTPNLDAMAAGGLRFERFYAAAPVCSPTRGSVLTGRHPFRYGIYTANAGHMKPPELTLAELLKTKGYRTGHFGKWHLGTLTKTVPDANRGGPRGAAHYSPPQDNGFDVCFSTESKVPTWDPMWVPADFAKGESRKNWWAARGDTAAMQPYNTRYWDERGEQVTENLRGDNSRVIADRAVPFIRAAAAAGDPFFAVVWFHTPHLPVVAGPEYAAKYRQYDGYTQHYCGCITAMDEQVGRLRTALRDEGVAEDTMVWFCSDNGPEGNDEAPGKTGGFRGRKRSLYEGGVRVPGLVEWPAKVKPGTTTSFPASTLDYLPTILAELGATLPDARPTDGIDLAPVLDGRGEERSAPLGFQSAGVATWVSHRYKLVKPRRGAPELYDLIADPFERHDIAAQQPELVDAYSAALAEWQASCKVSDEGADYAMAAPILRFGAIADCQFANVPSNGPRHYKLAKTKLAEAVDELNTEELDFAIHLGDFIDRDWASFDAVAPIYARLKTERYHLLGNHDFEVADDRKADVPGRLGLTARYYDFTRAGWRFIVLDGNQLSLYAHPKGSYANAISTAYHRRLAPAPPTYNGAVGADQLAWLESKLKEAEAAGERVILFNHFPLLPAGPHTLWNAPEVLERVSPYAGTVAAWINGHNHAGGHAERGGIHFLTLNGMLDTETNAYAVIELFPDRLEVIGRGRQPSLTLKF